MRKKEKWGEKRNRGGKDKNKLVLGIRKIKDSNLDWGLQFAMQSLYSRENLLDLSPD